MATAVKLPTTNDGGWDTAETNAYADDGQYATTAPAKNATETVEYGGFGFDAQTVPDGSTINSCTLEVQWKVSTTSSVATLGAQVYVAGSPVGSELVDSAEPTTDTIRTTTNTGIMSASQLRDVAVRVRATRGNSNTAVTASLDYVKLTVDFTAPVDILLAASLSADSGTSGAVSLPKHLTSSASAESSLSAGLQLEKRLSAAVAVESSLAAALEAGPGEVLLSAALAADSSAAGALTLAKLLAASLGSEAALSSLLATERRLSGSLSAESSLTSAMTIEVPVELAAALAAESAMSTDLSCEAEYVGTPGITTSASLSGLCRTCALGPVRRAGRTAANPYRRR